MSELAATFDAHVQAGLLDPDGLPVVGSEQADALMDQRHPKNGLLGSDA